MGKKVEGESNEKNEGDSCSTEDGVLAIPIVEVGAGREGARKAGRPCESTSRSRAETIRGYDTHDHP